MLGGILLVSRIRSCLWLFGWVVCIHLLTSLLGFGLLSLVFDPLGGGGAAAMPCVCIVLAWFLWGWITPRKIRAGRSIVLLILVLWTALTGVSDLLWGDSFVFHLIPQYLTSVGLAELGAEAHHVRWYFDALELARRAGSHFLLPAVLGLGMLLPPPKTSK